MTYSYSCSECSHEFELYNIAFANKDDAIKKPCPLCKKKKIRCSLTSPSITHGGAKTVFQRAGDGWKEVQKKIQKSAGVRNTIKTK